MSTLLITELYPNVVVTQKVRVRRDVNIAAIRPYIYKQGTLVDGQLQLRVLKGVTVLSTKTLGFAEINAAISQPYAHGYIRFEYSTLPLQVAEGNDTEEYILEVSMINHTLNTSNYLGLVKDWDDSKYTTYGSGDSSFEQPNGFEIFEYRS